MRPLGIHLLSNKKATQEYWGLCFTAEQAGSTVSMTKTTHESTPVINVQSSLDGVTWEDFIVDSTTITLANVGDKVYFKAGEGGNTTLGTTYGSRNIVVYNKFVLTGKIAASGNVMSLLNGDDSTITVLTETATLACLFRDNTTSLTTAPELPATTLADSCYYYMFYNCKALTTTPELPATTLADSCYYYMFYNCSSLTTAPELPATTLADSCYYYMFYNCSSLTQAPALPATTLADRCYYNMFSGCTSLTSAPELPATTLNYQCYYYMFKGCTSLIQAPALPATTLAEYCYYSMFQGCTSLTQAPALPATTLVNRCYFNMFYGCTSLTQAPELPATTLADRCYQYMFYGCTSLKSIKVHFTEFSNYTEWWVNGIKTSGTFYCPTALGTNDTISRGVNYCPSNWTVINTD